jgi:hypothetical protein
MISPLTIFAIIRNSKIVQSALAIGGLVLGYLFLRAKHKAEGAAEANAKNEAKLAAENEQVRETEHDIRQAQVDAANKRPLNNKRAADRVRNNGL